MARIVSKKYATALFEIGKESDMVALCEEADLLINALENETNFLETVLNPRITSEQKWHIFENSFKGMSTNMMGFINVVIRKNRESELLEMLTMFKELAEADEGIIKAEILSATDLTSEQTNDIKQRLELKTNKKVNVSVVTDPLLIGGFCIRAGGYVYDASVKKQLSDMQLALLK